MEFQYNQKTTSIDVLTRGAPSNLDTFKETAEAIIELNNNCWSNLLAENIIFDDSIAHLWVNNIKSAIDRLDSKTDEIDEVNLMDYGSYVNSRM